MAILYCILDSEDICLQFPPEHTPENWLISSFIYFKITICAWLFVNARVLHKNFKVLGTIEALHKIFC